MVVVVVVVVSKEFGSVIAVELADDKVFIERGIEVGGGLFLCLFHREFAFPLDLFHRDVLLGL